MKTHTSAYVSIRQHTSAYVSISATRLHWFGLEGISCRFSVHENAYVSIRQHTSAYVSISASSIRQLPVIADGIKTARFTNSSVSDSSSTLEILRNKCESSSPSVESSHSRRSCRSGLRQYLYFCTSSCVSICTFVLANLQQPLTVIANMSQSVPLRY
jgi:hypothetical protein